MEYDIAQKKLIHKWRKLRVKSKTNWMESQVIKIQDFNRNNKIFVMSCKYEIYVCKDNWWNAIEIYCDSEYELLKLFSR